MTENCKNCERSGKQTRLEPLPKGVTTAALFKKPDLPVNLCPLCDELPLAAALDAIKRRHAGE